MPRQLTQGRHTIQEKDEAIFLPEEGVFDTDRIARLLRAVGFTGSGRTFTKSQQVLFESSSGARSDRDRDSDGPIVLSVILDEERLKLETEAVVGVVTLLPGVKIEIEPKVGWQGLVDMLLTVLDAPYAEQPFSLPAGEDEERSVDPTDVIVLLAINYHRGIQTIRRRGLIRDIVIKRNNSYEGRGTIDLGQTLQNHAKGDPIPNWIESRPEYGNTVNSLLHFTGKQLLYFLKEEVPDTRLDEQRIASIFTQIHEDVRYLEQQGIGSQYSDLDEYAQVSIHSVPRQRRYYHRALYVARSLLTSSLFGRGENGPQRPLIDYVLQMENFFEDYSQNVIEQELSRIRADDPIGLLNDVTCEPQKQIRPFTRLHGSSIHHRPDHLLIDDDETIGVLDSKYYQRGENPVAESGSRSRMFAYAYLKDAHYMAFICPLARAWRESVHQTGDEVRVVAPDSEEFEHDAYRQAIQEYLRDVLRKEYPELELFEFLQTGGATLCRGFRSEGVFEHLFDTGSESPFSIANLDWFIQETVSGMVKTTPLFRGELEGGGSWLKTRLRSVLTRERDEQPVYPQHQTTCVPVYHPSSDGESEKGEGLGRLVLFLLQRPDDESEPTNISKETIWIR